MNDMIFPAAVMEDAHQCPFERLDALQIPAPVVPYPAHETVKEGKQLRGELAGTFTKNLLLRDKKDRLFLFSIHEDRGLDLKTLHTRIGATGRLGFASAERIVELLGVRRERSPRLRSSTIPMAWSPLSSRHHWWEPTK